MAGNGKKVAALPDSGRDIPSKEYMGVFQAGREGLYFQAGSLVKGTGQRMIWESSMASLREKGEEGLS